MAQHADEFALALAGFGEAPLGAGGAPPAKTALGGKICHLCGGWAGAWAGACQNHPHCGACERAVTAAYVRSAAADPQCPGPACPAPFVLAGPPAADAARPTILGYKVTVPEDERQFVLKLLLNGRMANKKLTGDEQVWRIVNRPLAAVYEQLRERAERAADPPQELLVFHGTARQATGSIIKHGFDVVGFAGKAHGSALGKGVYGAAASAMSFGYAKPDVGGEQHLFLCSALTSKKICPAVHRAGQYMFPRATQVLPRWVVALK